MAHAPINLNSNKAVRILDRAYRHNSSVEEALEALHTAGYPNVSKDQVEQQFERWDAASTDAPNWH